MLGAWLIVHLDLCCSCRPPLFVFMLTQVSVYLTSSLCSQWTASLSLHQLAASAVTVSGQCNKELSAILLTDELSLCHRNPVRARRSLGGASLCVPHFGWAAWKRRRFWLHFPTQFLLFLLPFLRLPATHSSSPRLHVLPDLLYIPLPYPPPPPHPPVSPSLCRSPLSPQSQAKCRPLPAVTPSLCATPACSRWTLWRRSCAGALISELARRRPPAGSLSLLVTNIVSPSVGWLMRHMVRRVVRESTVHHFSRLVAVSFARGRCLSCTGTETCCRGLAVVILN